MTNTNGLDRHSAVPLYAQLEEILRGKISSGQWSPGSQIPSESELVSEYGLSRMTVRTVLSALLRDGLICRVQGKGTFVSEDKISAHSPGYIGIREQLEDLGYRTETKLLWFKRETADAKTAAALGTAGEVFSVCRLRYADKIPISLHFSYIPCSAAPNLAAYDTESEQLCVILEKQFGLKMSSVSETLESVSAGAYEAEMLGVQKKHPLLLLEQTMKDSAYGTFEYARVLFRGDKIKLKFNYSR